MRDRRNVTAFAVFLYSLVLATPAFAQRPPTADELRARGIERCKASRGVDCDTPEGQREWIQQEQPITDDQRRAAAASRRRNEQCKAAPGKAGC